MTHLFGVECDECRVGEFVAIPFSWTLVEPAQIVRKLAAGNEEERQHADELIEFFVVHQAHRCKTVFL